MNLVSTWARPRLRCLRVDGGHQKRRKTCYIDPSYSFLLYPLRIRAFAGSWLCSFFHSAPARGANLPATAIHVLGPQLRAFEGPHFPNSAICKARAARVPNLNHFAVCYSRPLRDFAHLSDSVTGLASGACSTRKLLPYYVMA